MNLKRIKDDAREDYENYLKTTPEGQKNSAAMARLKNWAEHFEPTLLSEDWQDDEHCVVVVGDKNSSVQMTINCYGDDVDGLKDWAIIDTYDHRKNWKNLPDDDWFLVNAIRIKLTHDDKLGTDLLYTIDDFLGENLIFGSDEDEFDDEIADSRKRVKDARPYTKDSIQKMSRVIKDFVKELEETYPDRKFKIENYGVINGDDGLLAMPEIDGCSAYVFESEEDAEKYILDGYGADYCNGAAERDYWFKGLVGSGYSEDEANDILDRNDWQTIAECVLESQGVEWFLSAYFGEVFYVDDYVIYF